VRVFFYSPRALEPWDWRNADEKGIGGSETSHIELAWRLAARGHEVIAYTRLPEDCPGQWRGTFWKHLEEADFSKDGAWLLYRCPEVLDRFWRARPSQPRWIVAQDTGYIQWSVERAEKVDRILVLCRDHARYTVERWPYLEEKLALSSNGLRSDLIEAVEAQQKVERIPTRLIYASSPDRGLVPLLHIFSRAREYVPDLTLHIYYGFDNIDVLSNASKKDRDYWRPIKRGVLEAVRRTKGVEWHGRIGQRELYRVWLQTGLWCYPTPFTETSCVTSMEAQALGAIPITNPFWALRDNVRHGVLIAGDPNDPLTRARYAGEIVRLVTQPDLAERIRLEMMPDARTRFDWDRVADQWDGWLRCS
jgi:glycosyltransferase involved in cell wall biosynthesis